MPTRLWIAAYSLMLGGAGLALTGYARADRASVEAKAAERVLFDATLAASSLDATLRVAALGMAHIGSTVADSRRDAERLAFSLPEASNIYVVDASGEVTWTAYRRSAPTLSVDAAVTARMAAGSRVECGVAQAPSEGGRVLALVRRIEGDRVAAALFSAASLAGSVSRLMEGREGSLLITDSDGAALVLAGTDSPETPAAPKIGPSHSTETVSLASVPISVTVVSHLDDDYRKWAERTALLAAMTVGFALASGAMIILGSTLYRRRLRVQELKKDIEGKELLYREVNHRVKNNLTIVQTVLELGIDEIAEHPERALPNLRSSIDRVRAVSLLHELLYRRGAEGYEDIGAYLAELAEVLSSAYDLGGRVTIAERHEIDMQSGLERLVPLALIVNELVTNACKYAFPGDARGTIRIESYRSPGGGFIIDVSDDGVGMAWRRSGSAASARC